MNQVTHLKSSLMLLMVVVALSWGGSSLLVAQSNQPITMLVVNEDLRISLPLTQCDAPAHLIRVAKRLGFPAGVEYVGRPCNTALPEIDERISIKDWTVREVLDGLVEADPAYKWADVDGVQVG